MHDEFAKNRIPYLAGVFASESHLSVRSAGPGIAVDLK